MSRMLKNGLLTVSDSTNRSDCWKSFRNISRNGKKIDFVICRTCSIVMKYNSVKTGTKKLLDHHKDCYPQQKLTEFTLPTARTIQKEDLEKIKTSQAFFQLATLPHSICMNHRQRVNLLRCSLILGQNMGALMLAKS